MSTVYPQSNIEKLRKEKQATRKEIKETTRKLHANNRETSRQMARLNTLRADIERQNAIITSARTSADSVTTAMTVLTDSITRLEQSLLKLQKMYATTLRNMQSTVTPANKWTFLFSAKSVGQFYRRMRYLKQFNSWRSRKAREITNARQDLDMRRLQLQSLHNERANHLQRASLAGRQLKNRQDETEKIVASLKKEDGKLRSYLKEKENQQRRLDSQIDKLIAQEQERQRKKEKERRTADNKKASGAKSQSGKGTRQSDNKTTAQKTPDPDRALSGSFESNKGNLLFPVAGKYRIVRGFGRTRHPDLPHVMTDNSGIDIEVDRGAKARSIFRGKVSAIFSQPGFNAIVMVRHGAYISIYAGLGALNVKTGDTVTAGQTLGTIMTDAENGNSTTLHFEIRHEREKLNPTLWVR